MARPPKTAAKKKRPARKAARAPKTPRPAAPRGARPYAPPELSPLAAAVPFRPPADSRRPPIREHVGRNRVVDLLERFGSPLYVLDEDALRERYRVFRDAFVSRWPETTVTWSVKTNWLSAVAAILRSEGAFGEVVSGFEYEICRDLGIPGSEIVFNGPWKRDEELLRAFDEGAHVTIDGDDELRRVIALSKTRPKPFPVGIRVNQKLNYPPWDKFGFSLEDGRALETARLVMAEPTLRLVRLHLHVGTYVPDASLYARGAEALTSLALRLERELGATIEHLDLGGGYATRNTLRGAMMPGAATSASIDDYAEAVTAPLRRAARQFRRPPRLLLEPGRVLVDEAMHLLTTVRAVKRTSGGAKAAILDAGVHILPTAYWYRHEVKPVVDDGRPLETYRLAGPLCMQIDVVRESVALPSLRAGDRLVVEDVGAYNFSQSMQFIQLRPPVALVRGDVALLVREGETAAYVRRLERLPAHLASGEASNSELARR
jgi:diaminopimelate decarboxylase